MLLMLSVSVKVTIILKEKIQSPAFSIHPTLCSGFGSE
jgi:hypothetical protein